MTPKEAIEFIENEWKTFPPVGTSESFETVEGIQKQIDALSSNSGKIFYMIQDSGNVRINSVSVFKQTEGITENIISREEWISGHGYDEIVDHFHGYMSAPTAIDDGVPLVAVTRKYPNRQELVSELSKMGSVYLYDLNVKEKFIIFAEAK